MILLLDTMEIYVPKYLKTVFWKGNSWIFFTDFLDYLSIENQKLLNYFRLNLCTSAQKLLLR